MQAILLASAAACAPILLSALAWSAHPGGRAFNLNIFIRKDDGMIASKSQVGRFTFGADKNCEWTIYTIRKDLDKPGVTNEEPPVANHCAPVTSMDGRFNLTPPGEGVEVSYGSKGFTASMGGEFVDHWTTIP